MKTPRAADCERNFGPLVKNISVLLAPRPVKTG